MTEVPTVSIVDDDEQVRESLAALVQSMNVEVACYASGRDFLERYSPVRPGCVVLDLRMPQINGLEVIQALTEKNIHVPIIMISGHGDIPAAVSAMKSGVLDFFEKPYLGSALIESVRRAIDLDARNRQFAAERADVLARYDKLNQEEKQILHLTAQGKPDKTIAVKLGLSLRTIQLRRATTMRKLEVHSRAEMIRLAQGLEPREQPKF